VYEKGVGDEDELEEGGRRRTHMWEKVRRGRKRKRGTVGRGRGVNEEGSY
jgi:hypothetical protein